MKFILSFLFFFILGKTLIAERVHIIPEPYEIVERNGSFNLGSGTKIIIYNNSSEIIKIVTAFTKEIEQFADIKMQFDVQAETVDTEISITVELKEDPRVKTDEGYIIDITEKKIKISAPHPAGLFYAFQSLKQLFPAGIKKNNAGHFDIPCAYILDYPQYVYRGMDLDVSRHFFPALFIKHYLDILSSYKINIFHWHITDSHGWRLEIKQYPKLTSVGAWRADRKDIPMTIAEATGKDEPATYGGFYTQEEVKEIIQYAKDRFITVIPEIEMPGHCTAALVAYPAFNCLDNKSPLLIPCGYPGDLEHNFCVGYDSTYVFLNNILKEVIDLFPSPYIHIGGDEVRGGPWLACPRCRRLMKEKGLTNARQVQAYFTRRIDSFITANGRRTIGWEEILLADISPNAIAMAWHGPDGAMNDLSKGYDVVMAPYHYTYFDFYQSDPGLEDDITYAGLTLDTVYAFNPVPAGISGANKHILGGEASLWTENVETAARIEYMLLPRLFAFSEMVWSPREKKNYRKFIDKTEEACARMDALHINYAKSMYNVGIAPAFDQQQKKIIVTLHNQVADKYPVRYTTDGSIPTPNSLVYKQPLALDKSIVLQTALFDKDRILGKVNKDFFMRHKAIGKSFKIVPAIIDDPGNSSYYRLNDGIFGTMEPYDGRWLIFYDSVKTITIDLGKIQSIQSIRMRYMEDQVGNIYLPKKFSVGISADGMKYKRVWTISNGKIPSEKLRHIANYEKSNLRDKARFINIKIENVNLFPADHQKNILLLDEIVVQ